MMRKRRCAIYTRQSSVPSHRETSCNAQFDKCLKFIASMKPIGWEWIGTRYDDAGYGGATLDRPALQELIQLVAVGGVDIVVVEYLDRLSRSVVDVLTLMESFRDHGVDLRIVTCPDLTISPSDNFMINLLASFAEFERALIGERIREARAILKSHGKRVGGAVPFGYDADPLSKQRVVNAEESARVRAFFEMAAEGMTPSQIADVANERGWRTKKRDGKNSGGNRWTARQILSTLGNATYLGLIKDGDALRPGVHEGIVSESLFARVRQIIESRRTRKPGRTEREGRWPLKGLIRCARCGRIMSSHTTRHGNKIYRYYRCRSQAAGRPPCPATQIAAHEIETFVMHALNTLGEDHRPEQRSDLAGFSEAWGLLSEKARRGIIPKIVSEVGYDPDAGRIFLTMNLEALREYAQSEPSVSRST